MIVPGRALFLDTNLLLLLLAGITAPDRLTRLKRLEAYTLDDFELLHQIVRQASRVVTTPNVMTEVTNLTDWWDPTLRREVHRSLRIALDSWLETYVSSKLASREEAFERLCFSDCAAAIACSDGGLQALTVDVDLYLELSRRGVECMNFHHLRSAGAI